MADYPCKTCTMVKYPDLCENKACWEWQKWFINRWEELRRYYYGQEISYLPIQSYIRTWSICNDIFRD